MDYKQFLTGYKAAKDKEAYVKKHMKRLYVPYTEKMAEAKKISELATHVEINGRKVYKKDTPLQYFLTTMRIIALYTDVTGAQDGFEMAMYDAIVSSDAITSIFSCIPESEITQFKTMIDMYISDIYENERDLVSYIETKIEAINLTSNQIFEALGEIVAQTELKDNKNNIVEFPNNEPEGVE